MATSTATPSAFATPDQKKALALVDTFADRGTALTWYKVDKDQVCQGLRYRVMNPWALDQGSAGLCGPVVTLYDFLTRDPAAYVRFVVELCETGESKLGMLPVKPSRRLLSRSVPDGVPHADWVPMSALRNSENAFFSYTRDKNMFAGITMPKEIVAWLGALGYKEIVNKTNLLIDAKWKIAAEAAQYYRDGYRVILFINAKMLDAKKMTRGSAMPNHWVVLTSDIISPADAVEFKISTWGEAHRPVPGPGQTLWKTDFLDNFYGFIAAHS